ncbi:dihydroorotate oxidase [Neisseria perflava]|uniref:dihydroorotate oxidase n=1 Tax=Neisseria perflava TaxID=33053 RepID=UPI0020A06FBE|nr:dihydroorotate oxidase [Neisseria perflava]MCP1660125.1 dihydroorotate dehydrogenase (fumarate) [Neisseria perflava]MCP1772741.1 dihydroorotate dehydrogenase (fumarate) [Neisseria perflava]
MISTATTLAGFRFDNCIMNAAGVYDMSAEDLDAMQQSAAASFVTKSATVVPRAGNPEPRYRDTELGSINSMGLPNHGLTYYLDYVSQAQKDFPGKTYFVSLTGFNVDEDLQLLKEVQQSDFKGIVELNLSCPNVPGKPQTGYDFETVDKILDAVFAHYTAPLGIKMPPYFDLIHFDQIAAILNKYPLAYVNSVNSIGNGLCVDIDSESVLIKPKNGFGGIGGAYLKPTALANVFAFRQRLNPEIQIIGTGGVLTGQDVFEHILCGADMVQVGTLLHQQGTGVFAKLTEELKAVMQAKGYNSIDEFKGKLKTLD